ncbi:MAG: glycosyltransferase [Deltaproteobacteria bacterium]|nr:glycosyltransferase [Deltaproteobacteria bacterium]
MEDKFPLVSVIVRTKDRPHLLREALESIAAQSYSPVEVIIVNDGGVDITNMLQSFEKTLPHLQYLFHSQNIGRAAAANSGIRKARGRYIAFLDDDDIYLASALEVLIKPLLRTGMSLAYGTVVRRHYLPDGNIDISQPDVLYAEPFNRELLFLENYIPLIAILVDREAVFSYGLMDQRLSLNEDWDFLLNLVQYFDFLFIDQQVAEYRCFGVGTTTGTRFSHHEMLTVANEIRTKWWDKVSPAAVNELLQYIHRRWEERMAWSQKKHEIESQTLTRQIAELELEKHKLEIEKHKLEIEKHKLHEEAERYQNLFRKSEQQNKKEIAQLEGELNAIKSSRIWRLTRPWRELRRRHQKWTGG